MTLDAALLVDEGVAALRALGVEALPDDDLVVLSVLLVHLVVRVNRAVLLEGPGRRLVSCS